MDERSTVLERQGEKGPSVKEEFVHPVAMKAIQMMLLVCLTLCLGNVYLRFC
ncbi:hypothetical protein CC86DRAFT_368949 [Ophiobolus disseminans]|uniref:Uncharacterized protein n=1 Tax=Ophiobolus disseminans TaxID=1469910 RepID=A0A6A7A6N0_9PLEO|nr:hypothetical protein CC86DRAFT_368949 [Ophiobolus disseminans]